MMIRKRYEQDFSACSFAAWQSGSVTLPETFVLAVRLNEIPGQDCTLLDLPECLTLRLLHLTYAEHGYDDGYARGENYFAFDKTAVTVLQATVWFCDDPKNSGLRSITMGIPLSRFDVTKEPAYLVFDGVSLRWVFDDVTQNEDYPTGRVHLSGTAMPAVIHPAVRLSVAAAPEKLTVTETSYTTDESINFYTPGGYNTFVGDVSAFWHDGTFHILYLMDRHHHMNRWGGGAHPCWHVTTRDFITWEEQAPLCPITKQWESVGTGVMLFWQGKYYYSHGWHSDRALGGKAVYAPVQEDFSNKHGYMPSETYENIYKQGLYPDGAALMVSDDGIHFTSCDIQYHAYVNPSVDIHNGNLRMFTREETWENDGFFGNWKRLTDKFPPTEKPLHNTGECPSAFTWNGYQYLIMGCTGYWRTDKNGEVFHDCSAKGEDIYDGLLIPMATVVDGKRAILAGWLNGIGFGSALIQREFIQYPDGTLGMKWVPELAPRRGNVLYAKENPADGTSWAIQAHHSHYFEINLAGTAGRFALRLGNGDGTGCEIRLNCDLGEAQIAEYTDDTTPAVLKPLWRVMRDNDYDQTGLWAQSLLPARKVHTYSYDFAIPSVPYPQGDYTLRVVLHDSPKIDGAIVDVEIAGCKTMVSLRRFFAPDRASIHYDDGMTVKNVTTYDTEQETYQR